VEIISRQNREICLVLFLSLSRGIPTLRFTIV
jgi:hypothetical protein